MSKKTEQEVNKAAEAPSTGRTARKKVYQPVRQGTLPSDLVDHFKKDNYDLKLVRWILHGEEDYRYLKRREDEGYEFVTKEEIPDWYLKSVRLMDTKGRAGLVILGDLCLMKIDSDLRNSRRKFYQDATDREMDSVDIHVLEKKGFRNLGTKSKVLMREPKFQE